MQEVSENWKNAHKQSLLNESFVEISLDISDADAQENAKPSDNGAIYISNSSNVTGEISTSSVYKPYATLEQNTWVLGFGDRDFLPESPKRKVGYVSDVLSDENCVFIDKTPTIILEFKEQVNPLIPGVTITWSTIYDEYASDFIVRAYNGNEMVAEKEVIGNRSVKSLVLVDIENYTKIMIHVTRWCLPHHRARMEHIFLGMNRVYSKSDLFNYSHKQSVSPISTSLPKNEISFSVDNINGEYNVHNEGGLAKYLMERQKVKVRYGLKMNDGTIEWVKGGEFYLSEWSAKQNGLTADFTARDSIEFMSAINTNFLDNVAKRSLWDMADYILTDAKKENPLISYSINTVLINKYVSAPLPEDTLANCLQLIANAGECVIYHDREGKLLIEPINDTETDYAITPFNSYSKAELTLSKPLKQVDVKVYSYTLTDGVINSTYTITHVVVGTTGETIVIDNPLITDVDRATSVGTWVANYLKNRMTLDSTWRADVRLDALDIVSIENAYSTNKVRMTDVEFKYNGAFRGTGEGRVM